MELDGARQSLFVLTAAKDNKATSVFILSVLVHFNKLQMSRSTPQP